VSDTQAVGDPAQGGDIDLGAVSTEPIEAPAEPDYFNVDEVADRHVRLTIEGEEVSVPLREVLSGYNREAVSTRRFQQASEMQKQAERALAITQALERDPALTVQVLARQAGMSVEQFVGLTPAQQQAAVQQTEPEYEDPLERALAEERNARMALEQRILQREADERLQHAIGGLKQEFQATDEDARQVVAHALNMGVGPEMFPMIYQAMAYQRQQVQQQVTQQTQAQREAEEAQRRQQAAAASALVGTGTGATNLQQGTPPPGRMSIRDAFESAWNTHVVEG
jgi:hypothetical protein